MVSHTNAPWTPLYARHLRRLGHELLVVSFHPDRLPGVDSVFVGAEPFDKYRNKSFFITRLPRVRRILARFRPDLVFAPYLVSNGLVAALLARGPVVVSACGGDVLAHPDHPLWRRRIHGRVVRLVCRRAHAVHAVSENLERALLGLGVAAGKIESFPIGVDLEIFRPDPAMPRPEALRLICTRSHAPVYDLPTLIRALELLHRSGRRFHCTFAGGGHLLESHREQVRAAGLEGRVDFTGQVPHGEIPALLRSADVYVSPSLSDGASASLLEALATGLLPVVTRIDANTPWIRDGETGLLFEPGNAEQLASCLGQSLADGALRERALRENRGVVEATAEIGETMRRMAALFERTLARYSGR